MKKLLITIIILVSQFSGYSQDSQTKPSKQKVYNIKLREINGNILTGKLARATADSLYVNLGNQPTGSFYQLTPEQVDQITLRRKGVVGKSILIGTGIGILTGVILGLAEGDDTNEEIFDAVMGMTGGEKAAMYATGLGGLGAIVGTIVGVTARKKFIIKGKKENYRVHYNDIAERAMTR